MKPTKKSHPASTSPRLRRTSKATAGQGRMPNKDLVRTKIVYPTAPPRMEGKVKNAKLRDKKATKKQVRKPRKK